ncbi:hypothetical protein ACL9Z5_002544 [Acinetobacter calcoaceticus]|nr:sce7726 family protein [Acinetobacter baumannii]
MSLEYKSLSKIFNSSILNSVADGDFSYLNKIASNFSIELCPLKDFYDQAYSLLEKNYPNEYVFKNQIANKILCGKHSLNTATMLSEFRVGKNKADCIILNGKSTCYEIKTDYDSLIRLEEQLNSYQQLFDEVYVVCSKKYEKTIMETVPENFGVLSLTQRCTLKTLRIASQRTAPLNRQLLIDSLRQTEYKQLAEEISGEKISVPNMLVYEKCKAIIYNYNDDVDLNKKYIKILKQSRKNNDTFIKGAPKSLVNAAISYNFSKNQINYLLDYLNNEEMYNVLSDFKREIK